MTETALNKRIAELQEIESAGERQKAKTAADCAGYQDSKRTTLTREAKNDYKTYVLYSVTHAQRAGSY